MRGYAWDARTHMLIARLAVEVLPETPLKHLLAAHETDLQEDAVAPDESLRARYGKAEAIRHYIDLENFGADPFAALKPDIAAMELQYGTSTLPAPCRGRSRRWHREFNKRGAVAIAHRSFCSRDISRITPATRRNRCIRPSISMAISKIAGCMRGSKEPSIVR